MSEALITEINVLLARLSHVSKAELQKLLDATFYDFERPPGMGSLRALRTQVSRERGERVPVEVVREFLHRQLPYVKHKQAVRRAVRRNKMLAKGVGTDYQADLADVQKLRRWNRGARFLLCIIDIFTRVAHVEPIRAKTSSEMRDAFERVRLREPMLSHGKMATDAGKEFLNWQVQQWFRDHHIHHYTLSGDHKAAIVERFQRTLKERLHRVMTATQSYKYHDMLPTVVSAYKH